MDPLEADPSVQPDWPRYFLRIAYDGTRYHGWQRQPNGHSVQAELEQALGTILRQEKVITTGCGRTDTGVHARQFYLHFNAEQEITSPDEVSWKLNHILPSDISTYELTRVHDRAHARFDAVSRSYSYFIHTRPDPFLVNRSMYYPWPLDMDAMNEAASLLIMKADFASFCKSGGAQKTTICDIAEAKWMRIGNQLCFHIRADRFLRNMVRAIVGTLLDVGKGKLNPSDVSEIVEGKMRGLAGESVKACGLFLNGISYPPELGLPAQDEDNFFHFKQ